MRHQTVNVKNIKRLTTAYGSLSNSGYGMPKIGLVHGHSGLGKSTGITWLAVQNGGCFVTASPLWTPAAMLDSILRELGREASGTNQKKLDEIIRTLSLSGRPLFLDEADYLFQGGSSFRLLETLRFIHDLGNVPVILVGMERIARKITHREQLSNRVAQEIQFEPLDLEDTSQVAERCCDVQVAPDLLEHLHREAQGVCRRIIIGLAQIEDYAKDQGWPEIGLSQWQATQRKFFLERR